MFFFKDCECTEGITAQHTNCAPKTLNPCNLNGQFRQIGILNK
jgi:hypothetical protein